jgi:hypothetical protein
MLDRTATLYYIRDEMLTNPNVEGIVVWNAAKLAIEDEYLYTLMLDWARETEAPMKEELLKEVISYTDEILRKLKIRSER